MKQDLEGQAAAFNVPQWWEGKFMSPTEMAEENTKNATKPKAAPLYNPYEGRSCARQLSESVEDFLRRLPPQTTPLSTQIPWIFIANPYRKTRRQAEDREQQDTRGEAPLDEESDWAQFVIYGNIYLEELMITRHDIEKKMAGQAPSSITKAINDQKSLIVKKLFEIAGELHCASGKASYGPHYSELAASSWLNSG